MSAFIIRNSSCCDGIAVDLLTGTASVLYTNGAVYDYTNVSRRAIANLILNPNMSLGFWINSNLVDSKRVEYTQKYDALPAGCWYLPLATSVVRCRFHTYLFTLFYIYNVLCSCCT